MSPVRKAGLEPARITAQEPKSCVSTISPLPRAAAVYSGWPCGAPWASAWHDGVAQAGEAIRADREAAGSSLRREELTQLPIVSSISIMSSMSICSASCTTFLMGTR